MTNKHIDPWELLRKAHKVFGDIDAALAERQDSTQSAVSSLVVGNLEWQADVPEESFTWQKAKDYAESLGKGWRLPTRAELLTLVDDTRRNPACSVFRDCPSEWFWTSTPWAGSSSFAWYVSFYYGYANYYGVYVVGNSYRVRCVRDAAKEGG